MREGRVHRGEERGGGREGGEGKGNRTRVRRGEIVGCREGKGRWERE